MRPICFWLAFPLLLSGLFAGSRAGAEIYEWRDASGDRHFTNNREAVPADRQEGSRVLVVERAAAPAVEPLVQPAPPAQAEPVEERRAQVVYDRTDVEDAYAAGLRDAIAMTERESYSASPAVQIQGPLAVANANVDAGYPDYAPYYPLVTTSFDRGRSRHLTLRMLLQDQFQLDRDGPFVYERLNPVGLGPGLHPFLPRGLRGRVPQGTRVLFR
jgi:hypothetical protein